MVHKTEKPDSMGSISNIFCQCLPVLQLIAVHARHVNSWNRLFFSGSVVGECDGFAV